jgi:hypothetical protein
MEGKEKAMAIIIISLVIANQVLVMDLIFRVLMRIKKERKKKRNSC